MTATRAETSVVYAAGAVQGIVLVTFSAASTIFTDPDQYDLSMPLTIGFGQKELAAMGAALAGGVIAFYQLGYGIAAFGVGPLIDHGVKLPTVYGFSAIIAVAMGLASFGVTRARPGGRGLHPTGG
jgi:hypothetical protein